MRCSGVAVAALALPVALFAPAAAASEGFSDVAEDSVHRQSIEELHAIDVFAGTECGQGLFCPNDPVDRKTMAVWLVRVVEGQDPPAVQHSRFDDVNASDFHAAFIERMAQLDITKGCGVGTRFCPDRQVTRAEMAVFLSRAYNLPDSPPDPGFADVPLGTAYEGLWFQAHVAKLAAAGITKGCGDGTRFCPGRQVTRAEMASLLNRARTNVTPAYTDDGPGEPSESGTSTPACTVDGDASAPTAVDISAAPIVAASTVDEYFVLYVRVGGGTESELPVAVVRGRAGNTTLAENVEALPLEHYRVERYLVSDPADVDGDCIDDMTELSDPDTKNPVNPAFLDPVLGSVSIPDLTTFERISEDLAGSKYLKFIVYDALTDRPSVYFIDTDISEAHQLFLRAAGLDGSRAVRGALVYRPDLTAADGSSGVYLWWVKDDSYDVMERVYTLLAANVALIDDNLILHVQNSRLRSLRETLPRLRESRLDVVFDEDLFQTDFLPLNHGVGFGRLRNMEPDERPHPRDIAIYGALPNEMPRVAGIVSTVPQTPLSHVNLRAVQDRIPNAFVRGILDDPSVTSLLDNYVRYEVSETGWTLRAATPDEVNAHYDSSRPESPQTPQRDLSVTAITPLSEVGFTDWDAFGVKAANLAVLGTLGFPSGTVPDGFAIPFYFYDEFMKATGLYGRVRAMLADAEFQTDFSVQDEELKRLRKEIKDAETPQWITDALAAMHASFPEGTSLRYRSSTNNEDLPGFNGAGLYDSKTQHPDEEPLSKSLKQVYASLWNFRAFAEREFHRIDHMETAMGVLVHPNYSDEMANGVAVSFDPGSRSSSRYYVNTQLGEDLVTNPDAHSVPEEILLDAKTGYIVLATSNQVEPGQLLMSDAQMRQLHEHLQAIHEHFAALYSPMPGERFAMEIEFKITSDNILSIKQARPWVFDTS